MSPTARATPLRAAALAVLTLLSLGLPWRAAEAGSYLPGIVVPGGTVLDANGNLDIIPGYVLPGFLLPGASALAGYQTQLRITVAVVVILLWLALRRRSPALGVAAVAVAVLAIPLVGLQPSPGQLCYLAAVVCLVGFLRSEGLLTRTAAPAPG
ncbi:MAG: hypothetical protein ACR2KN_08900 [Geodermatophilaceae bacterium]